MTGRRRHLEDGPSPNAAGWLADSDEIDTDLADLDDDVAADLRSAMEDVYLEYYPLGLLGRDGEQRTV